MMPWPHHTAYITLMIQPRWKILMWTKKYSISRARPIMVREKRALPQAILTLRHNFCLTKRSKINRRAGRVWTQYGPLRRLPHNPKWWWHQLLINANFWMASAKRKRTKNTLRMQLSALKVVQAPNRQLERKRDRLIRQCSFRSILTVIWSIILPAKLIARKGRRPSPQPLSTSSRLVIRSCYRHLTRLSYSRAWWQKNSRRCFWKSRTRLSKRPKLGKDLRLIQWSVFQLNNQGTNGRPAAGRLLLGITRYLI